MNSRNSLFCGTLVRLSSCRAEDAELLALWSEDAEYLRNVDSDMAVPSSVESFRNSVSKGANLIEFRLRTVESEKLIGFVALHGIEWNNQCGKLAIGIGDPDYRNKGYGTDALRLILGYAFNELNFNRVGLDVISSNKGAIRAYEKVGFKVEGTMREAILRDGKKYDRIMMSILHSEYESR